MTNKLKIYYQNTRGLRTKCIEFYNNILLYDYDIIAITETWLHDSIFDSEICDPRYDIFRYDRDCNLTQKSKGGGVMLCVRRELGAYARHQWRCSPTETLWVTVPARSLNSSSDLHIAVAYIPGDSLNSQVKDIESFMASISSAVRENEDSSFLLLGDFNLPCISWSADGPVLMRRGSIEVQNSASYLIDKLSILGFNQHNFLKNTHGNTLDLAFSNFTAESHIAPSPLSKLDEHHPAFVFDATDITVRPLSAKPFLKFKYTKGDYCKIIEIMNQIDWNCLHTGTVDDAVEAFYTHLRALIDQYIPKVMTHKRNTYPSWYNDALINIIREKNKVHARWKRFKNQLDYTEFQLLRRRQHKIQSECFSKYVDLMESGICNNPKLFWSFVKSRRSNSNYPKYIISNGIKSTEGEDICAAFNQFFQSVFLPPLNEYPKVDLPPPQSGVTINVNSITLTEDQILKALSHVDCNKGAGSDKISPIFIWNCRTALARPLCIIYNRSLKECVFPTVWKEAQIVPIHKKGSKLNVEHYRPISIINIFAKIFEKLVFDMFYACLSRSIPEEQHGFMRSRSTATNLACFVEFSLQTLEKRGQVDVIYTDFEKAFDRVDHIILLRKLEHLGIHGDLLRWVKSYLFNRSQAVVVGGYRSNFVSVPSGVPQGSHLGPLFYNCYLYDIYTCLKYSKFLMYADDTKIFVDIKSIEDCEKLQLDLDRLTTYYENNRIKVNADKCQIITYTRKINPLVFTYVISQQPINRSEVIRDLGIFLDQKLNMTAHIDRILDKSFKSLGFVMRTSRPFSNTDCIKRVYYAYVRSILEYACCIWNPNYVTHIHRIERVQQKMVKYLNYKAKVGIVSYEEGCRYHRLKTLQNRRMISDVTLLYDLLNSRLDCPYLTNQIGLCVPTRRTRHTALFHVPFHRTNYGQNSVMTRLLRTYNKQYSHIDPFRNTRNSFKNCIIRS